MLKLTGVSNAELAIFWNRNELGSEIRGVASKSIPEALDLLRL